MLFIGIAGALLLFGLVFVALSLTVLASARLCVRAHEHTPWTALVAHLRRLLAHRRVALPIGALRFSRSDGSHAA